MSTRYLTICDACEQDVPDGSPTISVSLSTQQGSRVDMVTFQKNGGGSFGESQGECRGQRRELCLDCARPVGLLMRVEIFDRSQPYTWTEQMNKSLRKRVEELEAQIASAKAAAVPVDDETAR